MNNNSVNQYQFQSPFVWSDFPKFNSDTSLDNAYKICQRISQKHYENFPVASFIIPKKIRKYFFSIYAFARYADDIADEKSNLDGAERISILDNLGYLIENINDGQIEQYPILFALRDTINEMQLPAEPFLKLLKAFKMDVNFNQPETLQDLIYYCEHSANPVGELILRLFNEYTQETAYYSDKITTALQLINFWQDLSIDLQNSRCYIPKEIINKYINEVEHNEYGTLDEENQKQDAFATQINQKQDAYGTLPIGILIDNLLQDTEAMLSEGNNLVNLLKNKRLQFEIRLIVKSAERMLAKEKMMNYILLFTRPRLRWRDYFVIFIKSILWKF
ncbi:MAG TPA: squalene/phytoene synthase family protein [Candidatus Kapabacteria bacterium]|nr:squalene/phytoene synthase family protein [Candidatus Kapabacteria bacterium]